MALWTSPRTWTPGEIVTAAQLNAHARDNLDYLYLNRKKLLDYQQITSNVSVTATAYGSATAVINGSAIAYDGVTPVLIEFFSPAVSGGGAGITISVGVYDGSTHVATLVSAFTGQDQHAQAASHRFTPTAATHTYQIKAWLASSGTGTVGAGNASGGGALAPAFLRITTDGT